MTEYLIVGVASILIAWLAYRNLTLDKRVAALEATVSESELANPAGLQESVAQLIEELKAAADSACDDLAERIGNLREPSEELGAKSAETPSMVEDSQGVPVALIAQLAKKGLTAAEIAKKAGITQGEVELTLRFHQVALPVVRTLKAQAEPKRRAGKEIAVA